MKCFKGESFKSSCYDSTSRHYKLQRCYCLFLVHALQVQCFKSTMLNLVFDNIIVAKFGVFLWTFDPFDYSLACLEQWMGIHILSFQWFCVALMEVSHKAQFALFSFYSTHIVHLLDKHLFSVPCNWLADESS